jgi:hypothetical protein
MQFSRPDANVVGGLGVPRTGQDLDAIGYTKMEAKSIWSEGWQAAIADTGAGAAMVPFISICLPPQ